MTDIATKRVLVVEDDRKISDLLQNYLRAGGYEAEAAYNRGELPLATPSWVAQIAVLRLPTPSRPGGLEGRRGGPAPLFDE